MVKVVVFLIGCNHQKAQTYPDGSELDDPQNRIQSEFRERLIKAVEEFDPILIAEELHSCLLKSESRRSVAQEVALGKRISHRFCDMSTAEKEREGIRYPKDRIVSEFAQLQEELDHKYYQEWLRFYRRSPVREEFWIKQLGEDIHMRIIFICGWKHRETFRRRLESKGIEVKIEKKLKRFGASDIRSSKSAALNSAAYRQFRRNDFMAQS